MCLKNISEENKAIEDEMQKGLFEAIDLKQSVICNAGAGAGKTYSLLECLKYILNTYGKELAENNQKIVCITYTNVATNHINEMLGNSNLVKVSTIHVRIWEAISRYQNELVKIHAEKLCCEIDNMQMEIIENPKYFFFQNLGVDKQQQFVDIMKNNLEGFNKAYSLKATEFREAMPKEITDLIGYINNVADFRRLVSMIYRIERYERCLEKIRNKENTRVEYNVIYNDDRLDKMRISHDTVLEYGLKIIERYTLLRQIIIDQYPYIFIDEYQDTSENVVKIMDLLDKQGKEIGHRIFVGYFGDAMQNIYEDGVGGRVPLIHEGLLEINKCFNWRSFQEIIDVANKIRNDDIEQKSIYTDCVGGTVRFYCGEKDSVKTLIENYKNQWNINVENPLHCFLSVNRTLVEYSEFLHFYNSIKNAEIYVGANYSQLNTELLSDDSIKLGKIPNLLRRMMQIYVGVRNDKTPLRTILINEQLYSINKKELKLLIQLLKERSGETLKEFLEDIFQVYEDTKNAKYCHLMDLVFGIEKVKYKDVIGFLQENLYPNESDTTKIENGIEELLSTPMQELENWYNYISYKKKNNKEVVYHTYHGTKGLEFKNVIIVMEKDWGTQRGYFERFFEDYNKELHNEELLKFESVRNLCYVAVTRAIKNLVILYTDDEASVIDTATKIFGKVEKWRVQ